MTELAVYETPAAPALPDRTGHPGTQDFDSWVAVASDVIKLASHICDTPFVPDGLRGSAPAVAAAILAGREMGLGPMTSLANIDVIKGKPSQKALLMRAMIQSRGHKWEDVDVSDTRAVVRGCRKGESKWAEATFTADQAKKAGIDLGKYPADKLYARASSRLARRKFADVIMGMPYSDEDLQDGLDDDEAALMPSAAAAIEAPPADTARPRTAQRRARQAPAEPTDRPTAAPSATASEGASSPASGAPAPARTAPSSAPADGLPPLPGEDDEPGPTTSGASSSAHAPGSASRTATGPSSQSGSASSASEAGKDAPGSVTKPQLGKIWTIFTSQMGFTDDEKRQARAACEVIIGRALAGDSTTDMSLNEAKAVIDTLERCKSRDDLIELLTATEAARPQDQADGSDG